MEILKTILCGLAVLLFTSASFAQTEGVDEVYKKLDAFIAAPSPKQADELNTFLERWPTTTNDEHLAKVIFYCNLGYFQSDFLQFHKAIRSYETAKQLFQKERLSDYDMLNACYIPLGNLYTKTNALAEAESSIKEYILLAREDEDQVAQQAGLLNLSIVYKSKGSYHEAIAILEGGLKLSPEDIRMQEQLADNYFKTGAINDATTLVKEILASNPDQLFAMQLMGEILWELQERVQAISTLERVKVFQNTRSLGRRDRAKLNLILVKMYLGDGRVKDASAGINEVYALLVPNYSDAQEQLKDTQLFPENTLIEALELQAQIFEKNGRPKKALVAYQQAFVVHDLLQVGNQLQESKILWQSRNKERSERCLSLLYALYQNEKNPIWLEQALDLDQRSKSPVLSEARRWQEQQTGVIDDSTLQRMEIVRFNLSKVAIKMREAVQSNLVDELAMKALQHRYNKLMLEQRSLYDEINANRDQQFETSFGLTDYSDLAAKRGETWVSYFIGNNELFQFIISEKGVQFNRLASSNEEVKVILQYINEYNIFFDTASQIGNDPNKFASTSNRLYHALALPKTNKLLIIPDGTLSFVSFQSLLTETSKAILFSKMPFLIKESEILYAISLNDYLTVTEDKNTKNVLGFFPVFSNSTKELPYSLEESNTLQKIMKATIFKEERATASQFIESAAQYDILHISSHANGGTFTHPASVDFADRTLTLDELYGLPLSSELVVLSACETGVGKAIKGEGVQSVARAFQYSGAKNVLFSLWKVNDYSTAWLMEHFYREYKEGMTSTNSLQKIAMDYLTDDTIDNAKKSPYYWAAFVSYGKAENTFHNSKYHWVYLAILLSVIAGFFLFRRQKNVIN